MVACVKQGGASIGIGGAAGGSGGRGGSSTGKGGAVIAFGSDFLGDTGTHSLFESFTFRQHVPLLQVHRMPSLNLFFCVVDHSIQETANGVAEHAR